MKLNPNDTKQKDELMRHILACQGMYTSSKNFMKPDTLSLFAQNLLEISSSQYPSITMAQLKKIITNGVFGRYGDEVVYIAADKIMKWIGKHYSQKKSERLRNMQEDYERKERERIQNEDRDKLEKEKAYIQELYKSVKNIYDNHKSKAPQPGYVWVIVNSLIKISYKPFLSLPKSIKQEIRARVQARYRKSAEEDLKRDYKNITTAMITNHTSQVQVENETNVQLLFRWFDDNEPDYDQIQQLSKDYIEKNYDTTQI